MWQRGTAVRVAVFQQRWDKGRMIEHFITRIKLKLEDDTMAMLFNSYPPDQGFCITITPRREGD